MMPNWQTTTSKQASYEKAFVEFGDGAGKGVIECEIVGHRSAPYTSDDEDGVSCSPKRAGERPIIR